MTSGAGALVFALDAQNLAADVAAGNVRSLLGGGWKFGIDTWRKTGFRFVFLVAPTDDEKYRRAPLTFMAKDLDTLRATAAAACQQIDGEMCLWSMFLNADAMATVREEVLRDMQVEGTA